VDNVLYAFVREHLTCRAIELFLQKINVPWIGHTIYDKLTGETGDGFSFEKYIILKIYNYLSKEEYIKLSSIFVDQPNLDLSKFPDWFQKAKVKKYALFEFLDYGDYQKYLKYLAKKIFDSNDDKLRILRPESLIHSDGVFPIFIEQNEKILALVQSRFHAENINDNPKTLLKTINALSPYTYIEGSKLPNEGYKPRSEMEEIVTTLHFVKKGDIKIKSLKRKREEQPDPNPSMKKKLRKNNEKKEKDPKEECYLKVQVDDFLLPVAYPDQWCKVIKLQEKNFGSSTKGILRIIFATNLTNTNPFMVDGNNVILRLTKELVMKYILSEEYKETFEMIYSTKKIIQDN